MKVLMTTEVSITGYHFQLEEYGDQFRASEYLDGEFNDSTDMTTKEKATKSFNRKRGELAVKDQ